MGYLPVNTITGALTGTAATRNHLSPAAHLPVSFGTALRCFASNPNPSHSLLAPQNSNQNSRHRPTYHRASFSFNPQPVKQANTTTRRATAPSSTGRSVDQPNRCPSPMQYIPVTTGKHNQQSAGDSAAPKSTAASSRKLVVTAAQNQEQSRHCDSSAPPCPSLPDPCTSLGSSTARTRPPHPVHPGPCKRRSLRPAETPVLPYILRPPEKTTSLPARFFKR
jgi:hypothetical protein